MLSLYCFFKPIQKVSDPNGPLSPLVPTPVIQPPVIQQVNIEVLNTVEKTTDKGGSSLLHKQVPYIGKL